MKQALGRIFLLTPLCSSKDSARRREEAQPLGLVLGLFADRKSLFSCTFSSLWKPQESSRDKVIPPIALVSVAVGNHLNFFARAKESKQRKLPLFVHNSLRQSRIPQTTKSICEEKNSLLLRQLFFIFRINFILFEGTQRDEFDQN